MTDSRKIDPRPGESQDDFVGRCMGSAQMKREFPDADQRLAVCFSKFRERDKAHVCKAQHQECGPGKEYDAELGRCVAKGEAGKWSPEREMVRLQKQIDQIEDNRRRTRQEPGVGLDSLGNRSPDDREEPDPFLLLELLMAQALAGRAIQVADEQILPIYERKQALPKNPNQFNQTRLDDANAEAQTIWEKVAWSTALSGTIAALISKAFSEGEAVISPAIVREAPSVQKVLQGMLDVTDWRTNQYFNTQVLPAIQRQVENLFQTGAFEQADLSPIRATLDRRLKSVPYWRVVANANASRAYHYGLLKAAQFQGFRGYRFQAVLDSRTSKICRSVNGTQWFIADAVNRFEQVAGSDDPDEVKRIFPWVSADDVVGQNADALRDMGVLVPPLHGNCRSTLVPIF